MDSRNLVLTAWSYGLVGLVYSAFSLRLLQLGYWRSVREMSKVMVLAAVTWSALWGWFGLTLLVTGQTLFLLFSAVSDLLRYGCWWVFLLILLRPNRAESKHAGMVWMAPVIGSVFLFGLLALAFAVLGLRLLGEPSKLILFSSMASPVLSLVLLEQVFRNVTEDSRWSIKPLCLGLAGASLFDLYLFSQAVLFNVADFRHVFGIHLECGLLRSLLWW
jgi:hypothetical protein